MPYRIISSLTIAFASGSLPKMPLPRPSAMSVRATGANVIQAAVTQLLKLNLIEVRWIDAAYIFHEEIAFYIHAHVRLRLPANECPIEFVHLFGFLSSYQSHSVSNLRGKWIGSRSVLSSPIIGIDVPSDWKVRSNHVARNRCSSTRSSRIRPTAKGYRTANRAASSSMQSYN